MDERRKSPRRRVQKSGAIAFDAGRSVVSCTIQSLSETGALLGLPDTFGVPERFVLRFDRVAMPCSIARRAANEVGVAFAYPASARLID